MEQKVLSFKHPVATRTNSELSVATILHSVLMVSICFGKEFSLSAGILCVMKHSVHIKGKTGISERALYSQE